MTAKAEKVLDAALALTSIDRANLAEKIVASIGADMVPNIESAQLDEVERRAQQLDSGNVNLISGDDVMAQARKLSRQ